MPAAYRVPAIVFTGVYRGMWTGVYHGLERKGENRTVEYGGYWVLWKIENGLIVIIVTKYSTDFGDTTGRI